MKKSLSLVMVFCTTLAFVASPAFAEGFKEGASSLFLPTTGQAQNGQLGDTKTKIMAGVEVAAVTTIAILGGVVGGGVVWVGLAPLIANHAWSSVDAYRNAGGKQDPALERQMRDAQRTIELSRQRRFEREQAGRSDIRERVARAGEQDY